jgi:hypothetical protein
MFQFAPVNSDCPNAWNKIMKYRYCVHRWRDATKVRVIVVLAVVGLLALCLPSAEGGPWLRRGASERVQCAPGTDVVAPVLEGSSYRLGSPEEERRLAGMIYIRKCIRCHGNDGRGVWDIPDVPDFRNLRWQAYRTDEQLVDSIMLGRGAVMPPFRGQITLNEAWALVRYIRGYNTNTDK